MLALCVIAWLTSAGLQLAIRFVCVVHAGYTAAPDEGSGTVHMLNHNAALQIVHV